MVSWRADHSYTVRLSSSNGSIDPGRVPSMAAACSSLAQASINRALLQGSKDRQDQT